MPPPGGGRVFPLGLAASRWWLAPLGVAVVLGALVAGTLAASKIDDNPDERAEAVEPRQSRAVAITAHLVFREVDRNQWSANDPFYLPTWWLDDMPNFQQGIVAAGARFTRALADVSDAGQGPSLDLERAAGLLKYPGTVWKFDPSTSWSPTASSEKQYRNAARNLVEFNRRAAAGEPGLDRGAATLAALVKVVGHDLGAVSATIDQYLAEGHPAVFNGGADDVFYRTKGTVYAYGLILRELGWDYAQALSERELGAQWRQMVESLKAAAALRPTVVLNGAPDGALVPSHLTAQGFYLLRARAQLAEIADKLAQ
ncbi:MAG: DUF2333 family protein [Magnetospirillum sp.]|nr:DUF2333 family protein [Magnetospirillum sp.]